MAKSFDAAQWRTIITHPQWYVELYPELKRMRELWEAEPDDEQLKAEKQAVRKLFEQALKSGDIALAADGLDLDAERQPIDTIVIHHTSSNPGYHLSYMNAVQLLNVYVPYFSNPSKSIPGEGRLKGEPLWSNHVRDGRPVFYLYHWLMRMDGSFERLLDDDQIGWHAASWDVNCRSIGICLDNDYTQQDPTPDVLQKLANFIAEHYADVSPDRIFGHGEVSRHPTNCPGGHFISGWKQDLLQYLS